jgi:LmbE family N-acetylglucosaminyl deacetylase
MLKRLKMGWKRWKNVILIFLLLLGVVTFFRQSILPEPSVPVSALKPLSLAGVHRLIVFAPHCDDETLGAAGLILAAQRSGIEVKVVIATNGDGYIFATIRDFKQIYPRPSDYIKMGTLRQQESLAALSVLGVKPNQVDFLSYPDRGTPELWNNYWSAARPYRSPYSEDIQSPYPLTYDANAVYAGQDFLEDVSSILKSYRPDLVVYPHPDDVHPDHWGLNVFVRLAINLANHSDPTFHPAQFTYLVHRPDYPDLKGLRPQAALTPPAALYSLSQDWYRLDLPTEDTTLKGQAVLEYRSQLTLLRTLLESFVRINELFAPVVDIKLPLLAQGDPRQPSTWLDKGEQVIKPVQLDPTGDFITRSTLPSSDLVAVYVAGDVKKALQVCVQARENTIPELVYALRLKALNSTGIISYLARTGPGKTGQQPAYRSGPFACASVSLAELGDPWAIYVGANVVGGGRIIDEVGWQLVYISEQ